jgi:serine/threonine-protein kinase
VKVFDQGSLPDGSAYLTMELLSGESLRARLSREGRLSAPLAVAYLRQAARAIGAAHRRGIVHRDLKPENLFLCPDPELPGGTRVKVLDFGIAKLSEGGSAVITQTGLSMGTPAYMAPEQWWNARDSDARTDLYALGCVFYEMLVGRTPFSGPSLPEFMDQHRFQAPPLPGASEPGLAAFDAVIQKTLAKTPAERQASVEELLAALPGASSPSLSAPGAPLAASSPPAPPPPSAVVRPTPGPVDPGAPTERVARGRSKAPLVVVALALAAGGGRAGGGRGRRGS